MAALVSAEGGRNATLTIVLVAAAHFASHMLQLALPPLFPVLNLAFGASFTELGAFVTLFYIVSGFGQAAAGVLVDRYGAHLLLVGGLTLLAASIAAVGLTTEYWMLLPLAAAAGIGNCIFHPADLTILSHRIREGLLGRAYAAHGLTGALGYASAPLLVTSVAAFAGWRSALLTAGAIGLAVAVVLQLARPLLTYDRQQSPIPARHAAGSLGIVGIILAPVVLLGFTFFALSAFAGMGTQTFVVSALNLGYGFPLEAATVALTAYLLGNAGGMILGGFLADRTERHHVLAFVSILVAAALMLVIAALPTIGGLAVLAVLFLAGTAGGCSGPSRDILIRKASRGIGTGKVFGLVYSGLDLGSALGPLAIGILIDRGEPRLAFAVIGLFFALAAPAVLKIRSSADPGHAAATAE
jgi:FSR family fosmidomycin resistance protein-like MFS transporter